MTERLIPFVLVGMVTVPLAACAWQYRRMRSGRRTRRAAILRCAVFSVLPVVLYVGLFLALVGVEELAGVALIGDGYARSLPLVVIAGLGLAFIGTLVLTVLALFVRRPPR